MQRKRCLLIAVLLLSLIGYISLSQQARASLVASASTYLPPPVDWTVGVGYVSVCSVWQTADNGYVTVGSEDATCGGCWMEKTDEYGNSLWSQTYVQSGFALSGRAVQQTSDEGYVLTGYSGTFPDMSSVKALMVKTDAFGNVEWNKTYGGEGNAVAFSGQQTSDRGYALAGWSAPVGVDDEDFYLLKTDSSGNVEWNKTYGGSNNDIAWAMQQTLDDGFILAGCTSSLGAEGMDCWLVKTDANGVMEWNKTYGTSFDDSAFCVQQTMDGGYVFVGYENWDGGLIAEKRAFVIKTNDIGEIEWKDGFGGERPPTGLAWAEARSVDETIDGGFIVAGDVSRSNGGRAMLLLKTHSQGNSTDWSGTYIENARVLAVIQTADGGYAVTGVCGLTKIMSESVVILARFRYSPAVPLINESIAFNASYSYDRNLDIVFYVWDFDDGNISSTTTPTTIHRYDHSGAYNVTLRVEDLEGLNSSCSELVNVSAGPPIAHFEYSPDSPVLQESIVFDASGSYDRNQDIVSYLWDFDDGNITSTMNPIIVHRFESAGIYNVSLTVVDAEGLNSTCSSVLCAKIPTAISISTSTPSATAGYSVGISGTLSDFYGNVIKNETVVLYYVYSGYENWNAIAFDITDESGNYNAEWIPPAPSYFAIKTVYVGNYTHVRCSKNVTLSILPYGTEYLFSVESNSTVSSMGFDANNQTLSFMATGAEGTTGYARVTAAKPLVPDLSLLRVHVDGSEYNYTATDSDDSWVLLFVYDHSAHLVEIQLDSTIPEFPSLLLITLFMIGTLSAVFSHRKKHQRMRRIIT